MRYPGTVISVAVSVSIVTLTSTTPVALDTVLLLPQTIVPSPAVQLMSETAPPPALTICDRHKAPRARTPARMELVRRGEAVHIIGQVLVGAWSQVRLARSLQETGELAQPAPAEGVMSEHCDAASIGHFVPRAPRPLAVPRDVARQ